MSLYSPILRIFEQTYKGTRKASIQHPQQKRTELWLDRVLAQMKYISEGQLQGVCYGLFLTARPSV